MTKKEIKKGNKLIAKFIGFKFHPEERAGKLEYVTDTWETDDKYYISLIEKEYNNTTQNPKIFWDLKFNKSFDWLIPVTKKALSIFFVRKPKQYDYWLNKVNRYQFDINNIFSTTVDIIKELEK